MGRAATATINLKAVQHNYRLAKSLAPAGKALAIIKADAYGHGANQVAGALQAEADGFGVACIEEALALRDAGIRSPILLLEGFFTADELEVISQAGLWCAIHSLDQIEILAVSQLAKPVNVWLKMDSGMHRLGVQPEEYITAYQRLKTLPQVEEVVLMSHFSSADEPDKPITAEQIACFDQHVRGVNAEVSLANSAATLAYPSARRQWLRPGLMLYGASPFTQPQELADQLIPAMSLTSEVIAVRTIEAGESVGYGCTWSSQRTSRVATVAMGYADGYPRHARSGTPVLVNGRRSQIIGRVSMDMLAVDLTDIPTAGVGARVELWGENLLAADVAPYCDTIPYTLFTGITRRVHKDYLLADE